MNDVERSIVRGLTASLKKRGWAPGCADPVDAITATGVAWVSFTRNGMRCAIFFVEGNGEDIVSDCSAPTDADLTAFMADVDAYLDGREP